MASKYHARKIVREGMAFDSVKEYNRYCELRLIERSGAITDLQRQVKFVLLPVQRVDGKVVERACTYIADFVYKERGETVVEDVKSAATKTKDYIIKRKLLLHTHGLRVKEV